jgi:hypothetical protein
MKRKNKLGQNSENNWDIFVNEDILLWIPDSFKETPAIWPRILAKTLSQINDNWQNSHTYIRLNTYCISNEIEQILKPFQFEKTATVAKNEYIYLISDCSDQLVWEKIFETGVVIDCGRTFFILNEIPLCWLDSIDSLYNIAKSLSQGHKAKEYEKELSHCLCLCYSIDENLVIGKVNLSENIILTNLENLAKAEGLKLVLNRGH